MANTLKPIAVLELTAAFQTYYTVPALTTFTTGIIHIANQSASAATIQLCVVPSAGSPTADNAILWNFSIAANDFIELGRGILLPAASSFRALASGIDTLTLKIDGIETT